MQRLIAMLPSIDVFNLVMTLGLIGLCFAIYRIEKDTKVFREKNRRERQNESKRQNIPDDRTAIAH
ncbi:hypothetical protein [Rhodoferax ferrireducens]|uniref:hypothetical protein n=1 Tax=Rhodoferax ferrireducens TaxID=192843 RepID=UPI00140FF533|nr:hypothetical protein [Rhodoferax ferrireducens]